MGDGLVCLRGVRGKTAKFTRLARFPGLAAELLALTKVNRNTTQFDQNGSLRRTLFGDVTQRIDPGPRGVIRRTFRFR
jgi:hypothetical protein